MGTETRTDDREGRHPIQVAARRTGLTPDTLRAWERRYQAIEPHRANAGRRLYSDVDIERLTLLRRATAAGRAIGLVAGLSTGELRGLVEEDVAAGSGAGPVAEAPTTAAFQVSADAPERVFAEALAATARLDQEGLETALRRASVSIGRGELIDRLLVPLLRRIGDLWYEGRLRVMHEHMATEVMRTFLGRFTSDVDLPENAPRIITATPSGQMHGLGALLVAAVATFEGWRSIYLGTSLPAEEIAGAAAETGSAVVALSFIYPADDARLHDELRRLRRLLPSPVAILAGGTAAEAYATTLADVGAVLLTDGLNGMRGALRALRLQK